MSRALSRTPFHCLAPLHGRAARHSGAIGESHMPSRQFVTTEHVFAELGDALHKPPRRKEPAAVVHLVQSDLA
jgi:hypothetical protein